MTVADCLALCRCVSPIRISTGDGETFNLKIHSRLLMATMVLLRVFHMTYNNRFIMSIRTTDRFLARKSQLGGVFASKT